MIGLRGCPSRDWPSRIGYPSLLRYRLQMILNRVEYASRRRRFGGIWTCILRAVGKAFDVSRAFIFYFWLKPRRICGRRPSMLTAKTALCYLLDILRLRTGLCDKILIVFGQQ